MLYKPPGAVFIASYKEPLDQSAGNSLFSSEIILITNIQLFVHTAYNPILRGLIINTAPLRMSVKSPHVS